MAHLMRRNKQELSRKDTEAVLRTCTSGVLSTVGSDGFPYAVPLSYTYSEGALFFHSATNGEKLDAIARNNRVSFTVIESDEIVPEKFTTKYRSVIARGHAHLVEEESEKQYILESLVEKYSAAFVKEGAETIRKEWNAVSVIRVDVVSVTGKEGLEFVRERKIGQSVDR
ncbi:MAG: pyridoxamine 5'-phosphate oxidase family protein [Raoultibacter sp.]